MKTQVKANKCPKCGGKLVVLTYYQYTHEYSVLKNGKVSGKYKRGDDGPMEIANAVCENCGQCFEEGDFFIDEDGYFYLLEDGGDE